MGFVVGSRPVDIGALEITDGLRVMVVGPHPDDFDANAVTLRYLRERGAVIRAVVIGTGSGVEDSYCSPPTIEVKSRVRAQEQRDSLRFFGLADDAIAFPDMERDGEDQPTQSMANRRSLADAVLPFRPDVVMLPHGNDTNAGHRAVFMMMRCVLDGAGFAVTMMLSRDPKTISMHTDLYMPFGEDLARWKAEMLRFHGSQHQRNLSTRGYGFDERMLSGNRAIAQELGLDLPYAEAFELVETGERTGDA